MYHNIKYISAYLSGFKRLKNVTNYYTNAHVYTIARRFNTHSYIMYVDILYGVACLRRISVCVCVVEPGSSLG